MNKRLFLLTLLIITSGITAQKMETPSINDVSIFQKQLENGINIQLSSEAIFNNKKVVKIEPLNLVENWSQQFEINNNVRIVDIISHQDDHYFIVGYEKKNSHNYDICLYNLCQTTGLVWSQKYENEGIEIPKKMIKTIDDNLIIGGFCAIHNNSYFTILTDDLHLLKTDLKGNRIWAKTIGLKKIDEEFLDMSLTADNELLLLAKRKYFKDKTYIAKIDKFGNISWQSEFEMGHFISKAEIFLEPGNQQIAINAMILDLDYNSNELFQKYMSLVINNEGEEVEINQISADKMNYRLTTGQTLAGTKKIMGIVKSNSLNIRNNPTLTSGVVASIEKGDLVEIVDKSHSKVKIDNMNDYWYLLRVNENDTGWAYGYFIDVLK